MSTGILEEEMCDTSSAAVGRFSDAVERCRGTVFREVYNWG